MKQKPNSYWNLYQCLQIFYCNIISKMHFRLIIVFALIALGVCDIIEENNAEELDTTIVVDTTLQSSSSTTPASRPSRPSKPWKPRPSPPHGPGGRPHHGGPKRPNRPPHSRPGPQYRPGPQSRPRPQYRPRPHRFWTKFLRGYWRQNEGRKQLSRILLIFIWLINYNRIISNYE